ncbi:16262_t:CDS:2 [Funneliformis geosporum]|nr:16262_t:CDS:2 [Funneliformis geosporum]
MSVSTINPSFEVIERWSPDDPPNKRVKIDDEDLNKFWQALKNAFHSNNYQRLSDSTRFLGKEDSALKIRKCYRDLLSVVFDDEIRKLRITGNPGIGKTYFGYYLLYQLALRDAIVVYDNFNETRPIIFEGEKALISDSDGIEVYLRNPAVWYIVDGRQPKNVNAKTILICSPKRVHYAQFDKYTGATIRNPGISSGTISNWGGIPRYVLEKANDRTQQSKLNDAIKTCKENIFDLIGERCIERSKFSHMIVHIDVNLPVENELSQLQLDQNGKPPYTEVILRFASNYVREKVTDKLETSIRQRLLEQTKAGTGNSLLGSAFEYIAHKILRNGGKFDVRPLDEYKEVFDEYNNDKVDPDAIVNLPKQELTLYFNKTNIDVIKDNEYYQPWEKNFPSIDSIIAPNRAFR